jgi:predicted TPR repeat methyltransferase
VEITRQQTVWKQRMEQIENGVDAIQLPREAPPALSQDREWCFVTVEGERRRIRFHDYASLYKIPGLYETLFYEELKCCSPSRVTRLLADVIRERGQSMESLRVLDLGAGNGMVGDELRARGVEAIVGVDIIPEARAAARRDRKGVYEDYLIADMMALPEKEEERLRSQKLNCLTTVAALGFGDIPPGAFLKALQMISTPGWVAFNIKETFLQEKDDSGFSELVRELSRQGTLRMEAYRRYRHRLSIDGEPLYYVAMVATKRREVRS